MLKMVEGAARQRGAGVSRTTKYNPDAPWMKHGGYRHERYMFPVKPESATGRALMLHKRNGVTLAKVTSK